MSIRKRQKSSPPIQGLEAPPLQKFLQSFSKSQVIFDENSLGSEMYVVHSGRVNLYKEEGTRRALLASVGPGDFFGEMALVDESPRSATAIAAKDNTLLVVLDRPKFFYLLRHQPEFALMVMQRLCERLRSTTALVRGLKR